MTVTPLTDQQLADREEILAALSVAGAFCGECGFEPGEIGCSDCVRVRDMYADALAPITDRLRAENAALDDLRLRAIDRGEKLRAELADRRTEDLTLRGLLVPADGTRRVPMALGDSVAPAVEWLIAELATARAAAFGEAAALLRAAQAEAESAELERHSYLDHETQLQHDAVHWAADLLLAARTVPDAR